MRRTAAGAVHEPIAACRRLPLQGLICATHFWPPRGKYKISCHKKGKGCWWLRRHQRHFHQPHRSHEGGRQEPPWAHRERLGASMPSRPDPRPKLKKAQWDRTGFHPPAQSRCFSQRGTARKPWAGALGLLYGLKALLTTGKSMSQSSPLGAPRPPMVHVIRGQHQGTRA